MNIRIINFKIPRKLFDLELRGFDLHGTTLIELALYMCVFYPTDFFCELKNN
jgi:hypothetical protein